MSVTPIVSGIKIAVANKITVLEAARPARVFISTF
jgi:hypothetical protein